MMRKLSRFARLFFFGAGPRPNEAREHVIAIAIQVVCRFSLSHSLYQPDLSVLKIILEMFGFRESIHRV